MALRGQRFELDLDADNFTANVLSEEDPPDQSSPFVVKEIQERAPTSIPVAPKFKATPTGFPEHKTRKNASTFKQRQAARSPGDLKSGLSEIPTQIPPSDRAIINHVSRKYGFDPEAKEKAEISEENKRRIAQMSEEDIEEARSELMTNLSPAFIQRLLRRANIDEDSEPSPSSTHERELEKQTPQPSTEREETTTHSLETRTSSTTDGLKDPLTPPTRADPATPAIHFPVPPRSASSFVPLDPSDPNFLADLKAHYFPDTPHDPSTLEWLQDPTSEELQDSDYNPDNPSFPPSSIRFSFTGRLIPPRESLAIDVRQGLHHHGDSPASAGYTVPELALLARSTLPAQRCIAFQVLGRILYRLGRGDFGPRGSVLQDGLWDVIENERAVETMMAEANRARGPHLSAKAYATEALWLWRKGGGGDRGLLKKGEKIAK